MFTPLGTAVTSGSGSGGGAAAQVDFVFSGIGGVPFFLIQESSTQVGTAPGTPRPTGEKPNSEPRRPHVDFFRADPRSVL